MNTLDRELTKFKLELAPEWRALQTHKWRRPKWIKFPRLLDDGCFIRLSDKAKAALPIILLIASENPSSQLPEPDRLYVRLNSLGLTRNRKIFTALIHELNQCGFLTKTTPELQSLRVTEFQNIQSPLLRKGDLAVAVCEVIRKEEVGNEERIDPHPLAQPPLNGGGNSKSVPRENLARRWSVPQVWEITGTAEANRIRTEFDKRPESFRVVLQGVG